MHSSIIAAALVSAASNTAKISGTMIFNPAGCFHLFRQARKLVFVTHDPLADESLVAVESLRKKAALAH